MLLLSPLSLLLLSLWSLLSLLLLLLLLSSSVLLLSLRSWLSLPLWSLLSLLLNEKRLRSHAGGLLLGGRPEGVAERRAHRGGAKSSSSCKDQQCLCTAGACVIFKTVPLPALPLPALSLKTVPALPQVLVQLFSSVRSFRMTLKGYVNMEAQMTYVERVFQYIDLPVLTPPPANINHPLEEPTAPGPLTAADRRPRVPAALSRLEPRFCCSLSRRVFIAIIRVHAANMDCDRVQRP